MLREVLLGAWQSTSCLSRNVSTALQPAGTSVAAEAEAVGVRTVKVAAAGTSSKAYVNVSIQNWHTRDAVMGPVTGITGVSVVVTVGVAVTVGVLVVPIVAVAVGWIVAVGDPGCPAQAAARSTRIDIPHKNRREIFFILFSPVVQILCGNMQA